MMNLFLIMLIFTDLLIINSLQNGIQECNSIFGDHENQIKISQGVDWIFHGWCFVSHLNHAVGLDFIINETMFMNIYAC